MQAVLFVAFSTTLLVPSIRWDDLYVNSSATNCATGTGTENDPVCTISAAIALSSAGDRIFIAPGSYVENLVIHHDLELTGTGGAAVTTIDGGGIDSTIVAGTFPDSPVTLVVDGLSVTGGSGAFGGGIRSFGSLMLSNSTISGNYSGAFGGGISHQQGGSSIGSLRVESARVTANVAESGGGGIFVNGYVDVVESSISENEVLAGGGGGLFASGFPYGRATIESSTIADNEASGSGGGCLFSYTRDSLVVNSTLSGNSADFGGALVMQGYFSDDAVELRSVTITNNFAQSIAGGVALSGGNPSIGYFPEIRAQNSILAGNNTPLGPADGLSVLSSLGNNLVGPGGASPFDLVTLDPLLGPLADNGGPTQTHALLSGSPARDAANPLASPSLDQRGLDRLDGAPDIGAFEADASLCDGDGGDQMGCTACPCGNDAPIGTVGGCLNSSGGSARLSKTGGSSLSNPELAFGGSGFVPGSFGVLVSGSALAPESPANPCFGLDSGATSVALDGLRCAITGVLRHGSRAVAADGTIGVTTPTFGPNVAGQGLGAQAGFQAGTLRYFQCFYRELAGAGCQTQINTTQALRVVFDS